MIKALQQVGEYVLLMRKALTPPTRWSMFFKQLVREIYKLGVDSIWIVVIIFNSQLITVEFVEFGIITNR